MSLDNILIGVRNILQNHVIDCSQILPENGNIFEVLINTSKIHADVVKNNKRITEYREYYGLVLAQNCYNFLLQQGSKFWTDINEKDAFDFWKVILKRLSYLTQEKPLFGTIALDWFRILQKTSEKVSKLRLPIISTLTSDIIELFTTPNLPLRNIISIIEEWNKCLKIPRSYSVKLQTFQNFKETFHKVGQVIQTCGDYQMQSSLIECVLHYSGFSNTGNLAYLAEHWFSDVKLENIKKSFMRTCFKDFEPAVREFLNNLNINETFQDVCSVEGALVEIDGKDTVSPLLSGKFWIDFNFGSGRISVLCGIFPINKWTVLNIYNDFVNFVIFTVDPKRKFCKATMKLKMNFKENLVVSKYTTSESDITLYFSSDIKPDLCHHLLVRMFQSTSVPILEEVEVRHIYGKVSLNDNANTSPCTSTSTSDSAMNLYARLNSCDQKENPFIKPSKPIVRSPELSTVFETEQENRDSSSNNKGLFLNVTQISPESSCRSVNTTTSYDAFDTMQASTSSDTKIPNLETMSEFMENLNGSCFLDNSKSVISNSQLVLDDIEIPESCDESDGDMKRSNKRKIAKVSRSVQELREGRTKDYLFSQTDASGNVVYENIATELVRKKKVSVSGANGLQNVKYVDENKKRHSLGEIMAIERKKKKRSAPALEDCSRQLNMKKSVADPANTKIKFSQCDVNGILNKKSILMTDFFNQKSKIKLTKSVPSATITESNSVLSLVNLENDQVTSVYVEQDKLQKDTGTIQPIVVPDNITVIDKNIIENYNTPTSSANKNNSNNNIINKETVNNNDHMNINGSGNKINNINTSDSTKNNNTVIINSHNNIINNEVNNKLIDNIASEVENAIIDIEESFDLDENPNNISIIPTSQKLPDKIVNGICATDVVLIETSDDERDENCSSLQKSNNSNISSNKRETSLEHKTIIPLYSLPDTIVLSSDDECVEIPLVQDININKVNQVQRTVETKEVSTEPVQKSPKDKIVQNQGKEHRIREEPSVNQEIGLEQNQINHPAENFNLNIPEIPTFENPNENNLQKDPKNTPELINDIQIPPSMESQNITEKPNLVDKIQSQISKCTRPLVSDNQNRANESANRADQSKLDDLSVHSFVLDENTPPDGALSKKRKRKLKFKIQSPTTILKQISENFPKRQSLREELSQLSLITPIVSLVSNTENQPKPGEKTSNKKVKKRKSLRRSFKQKLLRLDVEKNENELTLEKQTLQERLDYIQLTANKFVTKEKSQISNNLANDTINSEIYNQVTQPAPVVGAAVQNIEIPIETIDTVHTLNDTLNLSEIEVRVSRIEYAPVTKKAVNIPVIEANVVINNINDSIESDSSPVQRNTEIIKSGNLPVEDTNASIANAIAPTDELTLPYRKPDVPSQKELINEHKNIPESRSNKEERSAESISEISSVATNGVRRKRLYTPAVGFEMDDIPSKRPDDRKPVSSVVSAPRSSHPCFLLASPITISSGRYSVKSLPKAQNKIVKKRGRKKKVTEISSKHRDYIAPKVQAPRDKITYSYKNFNPQSPEPSTSKRPRSVYSQLSAYNTPVRPKKPQRKKKISNKRRLDIFSNADKDSNTESNGEIAGISQIEDIAEREEIAQVEGIEEIEQIEDTVQTEKRSQIEIVTKIVGEEGPKKKVRRRRRKEVPQKEEAIEEKRITSRGRLVPVVCYEELETSWELDQTIKDFEQTRDNPIPGPSTSPCYSPDGSEFIPSPRYINKSPDGIDRIKSNENINDITTSSSSMVGRLIIETVNEIPAKPDWNLSLSISLSDLEISPRSLPPESCDATRFPGRSNDLRISSRSTFAEGSMYTEEIKNPESTKSGVKVTTGESQIDYESFNFDKISNFEEALTSKMPTDRGTDEFTEKVVQSMAYIIESCVPAELNKHNATYTIAVDKSTHSDVKKDDAHDSEFVSSVQTNNMQNDDLAPKMVDTNDNRNIDVQEHVILNKPEMIETNTRLNNQTTSTQNNYKQLGKQPSKQAQNLVQSSIDVFTQKSRKKVEQLDKESSRVCEFDKNLTSDQNSNADIINQNKSPPVKSTTHVDVVECRDNLESQNLENTSESVMANQTPNNLLEKKRNILQISPLDRNCLTQHWLNYNDKNTLRSYEVESYTLADLCAGLNTISQKQNATPLSVEQSEIRNEDSGNSSEGLIVLKNRSVQYNVDMATVTKSLSSMREISQQSTSEQINSVHISPIKFSLTSFVQPESLADLSQTSFYKFELSQKYIEKNSGLCEDALNTLEGETSTSGYEATNPNMSFNLEGTSESNLNLMRTAASDHCSMESANVSSYSILELSGVSSTPKVSSPSQYKTEISAINIQDMFLTNSSAVESDLMIDRNSTQMRLESTHFSPTLFHTSTINLDSSINSLPDLNFDLPNIDANTSCDLSGFSENDISQRFMENGTLNENIENFAKCIREELEIENEYVTRLKEIYLAFLECQETRNKKLQAIRKKCYKK